MMLAGLNYFRNTEGRAPAGFGYFLEPSSLSPRLMYYLCVHLALLHFLFYFYFFQLLLAILTAAFGPACQLVV